MANSIVHAAALALADANEAAENQRAIAARMSRELRRAQEEHDRRVEEHRELERLLPHGLELSALRNAVTMLREKGHGYVADIIAAYVERLTKAGRTGW